MKKSFLSEEMLLEHFKKISKFFDPKYEKILIDFYENYKAEISKEDLDKEIHISNFETLLSLLDNLLKHPFSFASYHQKIRSPFDYYRFGIDFIKPLIIEESSTLLGIEHLKKIKSYLLKNENVIFLANHQTEPDPQVMSLLLEKYDFSSLAEKIIYVAGERVITDPLAIPFSMGCDLICIYSKKYIDVITEKREEKQLHNTKVMHQMSALLKEGGKIIYVAPSGGRDRPNEKGVVEIAPFDPQSIEMFYLMAKKSKTKTHFFPLALATYKLLPPPQKRLIEMGETRATKRAPVHMAIGSELEMENFDSLNKEEKRILRKEMIEKAVKEEYEKIHPRRS